MKDSNAYKDNRRTTTELLNESYTMMRQGFRSEIGSDKMTVRFLGLFKAIKSNNVYDLYDKKVKFYKNCPPQELKFIKVINELLLVNLEPETIIALQSTQLKSTI